MNLFRAKNPDAVDFVFDKLIEEEDLPKELLGQMMKEQLVMNPDETLFFILTENGELRAFIFSYIPYRRNHLFILQAWEDCQLGKTQWPKFVWSKLRAFCDINGLSGIRCETRRSSRAFYRKWGMKVLGTILDYRIERTDNNVDDTRRRDSVDEHAESEPSMDKPPVRQTDQSRDKEGNSK